MKVYIDKVGDLLHIIKEYDGLVAYYWTDGNGNLLPGFDNKEGETRRKDDFRFKEYKEISFSKYFRLCK